MKETFTAKVIDKIDRNMIIGHMVLIQFEGEFRGAAWFCNEDIDDFGKNQISIDFTLVLGRPGLVYVEGGR